MRYLVGLPAFYLLVVAVCQCSNDGWEEKISFREQYLTELLNMRYSMLSYRYWILVKYLMEFGSMRSIKFTLSM